MLRNREFASAVSLARTTVERWPTPRAQTSLGVALVAAGRHEEGITELRKAVADDPARALHARRRAVSAGKTG